MSFAAEECWATKPPSEEHCHLGIRWQNKSIDETATALFESDSFADAQFVGMQFIL